MPNKQQRAARSLADEIAFAIGAEAHDTLIGAALLAERDGVTLAVMVVYQDESGPLMRLA